MAAILFLEFECTGEQPSFSFSRFIHGRAINIALHNALCNSFQLLLSNAMKQTPPLPVHRELVDALLVVSWSYVYCIIKTGYLGTYRAINHGCPN